MCGCESTCLVTASIKRQKSSRVLTRLASVNQIGVHYGSQSLWRPNSEVVYPGVDVQVRKS